MPNTIADYYAVKGGFDYNAKGKYLCYSVDPYSNIRKDGSYAGRGNYGLQWLADLASGGDGSDNCIYLSKMRAVQKRKMIELLEQIADVLEERGFEILGPAKADSYSRYNIPIADLGFDQLLEDLYS